MIESCGPRLTLLRNATRQLHERLHIHPLLAPLTGADLRPWQAEAALQAFHASYAFAEQNFVRMSDVPNAPVLEWLGKDMEIHSIPGIRLAETAPRNISISQGWGYLYVKQGSTLGGRVISKNLFARLGWREGIENHFFSGYGKSTGTLWKAFVQVLEAAPDIDMEEAAQHACDTFRMIESGCDTLWRQIQMDSQAKIGKTAAC